MDSLSSVSTPPPAPTVRLLGDIACPWSYLTLISLHRAFGQELRLEWHPFVLELRDLVRQRTRLLEAVNRYARQLEAPFAAAALLAPIDSRRVHATLLAAAPDQVAAVAAALFEARFAQASALSDRHAIETALAAKFGAVYATTLLAGSTARLEMVDRADRAARIAGVAEIPVSVLDDAYVIAGLQPPEAFLGLAELAAVARGLKERK
ncbi:MAG: hypothetical protein EA356_06110 [Geminicoccaceae bacterium]|nr:MAG: hypothetical protein EA356_06110 [Geminicoccaceae bacterium]